MAVASSSDLSPCANVISSANDLGLSYLQLAEHRRRLTIDVVTLCGYCSLRGGLSGAKFTSGGVEVLVAEGSITLQISIVSFVRCVWDCLLVRYFSILLTKRVLFQFKRVLSQLRIIAKPKLGFKHHSQWIHPTSKSKECPKNPVTSTFPIQNPAVA